MTCKEALNARYKVIGKKANSMTEYAPCLTFFEAQRFFNSLVRRGYKVTATPLYFTRSRLPEQLKDNQ